MVGENNGTKQDLPDIAPSPLPTAHAPLTPIPPINLPTPGYIPETTHRMQHNQKLDEIQVVYQHNTYISFLTIQAVFEIGETI